MLGMTLVRLQLPVRSPYPLIVPWTWREPASIAASAFATPKPGTNGNLERNSIHGPNFWQADLVVAKRIGRRSGPSGEFRVEVFDIFNHTNLAGIGGTLTPAEQYAGMPDQGVVQLGAMGDTSGSLSALRVFSGGSHNCAILAQGNVRCWGHNESGQLGYGAFAQVGHIGELRTPSLDYQRLNQADVCIGLAASGGCPGAVR